MKTFPLVALVLSRSLTLSFEHATEFKMNTETAGVIYFHATEIAKNISPTKCL